MKNRLIQNEKEYSDVLERISALMDAKLGTPEGDELDELVSLVVVYEEKHFPMVLEPGVI